MRLQRLAIVATAAIAAVLAVVVLITNANPPVGQAPERVHEVGGPRADGGDPGYGSLVRQDATPADSDGHYGDRELLVEVRSTSGEPVDSADVLMFQSSGHEDAVTVAVQDPQRAGVYVAHPSEAPGEWTLTVVAAGFAAHASSVSIGGRDRLLVRLAPDGVIRGRVVLEQGVAPPVMTSVIAYPSGSSIRVTDCLRLVRDGLPCMAATTTHPDGTFELRGIARDRDHVVVCGGAGWAAKAPVFPARSGDDDVTLVLWRAYGCVVRTHVNGVAPSPSSFARRSTASAPFPSSRAITYMGSQAILVQKGCDWEWNDNDWRRSLFLVLSAEVKPALDPVALELAVPGYRDASFEVPMPAISRHALVEAEFELQQEVRGFGAVTATFDVPYRLSSTPGRTFRCAVSWTLRSLEDSDRTFELAVPHPSGDRLTVEGVPVGSYEALLTTAPAGMPLCEAKVVSVTDAGATIHYELKDVGCLLIDVSGEGSGGVGTTSVVLLREGRQEIASFGGPPFVVECVRSGSYEVIVRQNRVGAVDAVAAKLTGVEVQAGVVTERAVELR